MLKLAQKLIFLAKISNFSKKAPSAPTFWALRAQNFAPPPSQILGAETYYFPVFGGRAPAYLRPWAEGAIFDNFSDFVKN